jgi:Tfp pilus assembly protein PilX
MSENEHPRGALLFIALYLLLLAALWANAYMRLWGG